MEFEWDESKRKSNFRKHKLDFADAETVFAGRVISILDDRENYGEDRWFTVGLLSDVVVVIAHTDRDNRTRIISMRKAKRYEAENYFAQIADELNKSASDEG